MLGEECIYIVQWVNTFWGIIEYDFWGTFNHICLILRIFFSFATKVKEPQVNYKYIPILDAFKEFMLRDQSIAGHWRKLIFHVKFMGYDDGLESLHSLCVKLFSKEHLFLNFRRTLVAIQTFLRKEPSGLFDRPSLSGS